MATISKLAINLGWNGQQAEAGLSRTAKKTSEAGQAADGASSAFGRLAQALKGANDVKSGFEMLRGVTQFFIGAPLAAVGEMIKLGGELETMQVKMGLLAGSFDEGAKSLENLRQITRDMGVPLNEVVSGFQQLTTAGINVQDAEKLLRTFSKISPLLGQGGIGQVSSGIGAMAQSGVAERTALDAMQRGGLKVYEQLAEKLSNITGTAYSVRDAMRAVEQGGVLASTAIQAMQQAANSPQALEAAQRISNSLEGQLARLREGFTELLRDVGDGLLKGLDVPAFLASLRGVFEAITLIVRNIVDMFLPIIDPQQRGDALEKTFKNVRDLALDASEKFAKMAVDIKASFDALFARIQGEINKLMARLEFGPVGLIGGGAEGAINRALAGEDKLADARVKAAQANADRNKKMIDEFFGNIRKKAEDLDANRAADRAQLPANAGPQLPNMREVTDQFSALRNIQLRAGQKDLFNAGEIQSALSGFLSKMQQPDAGINQRIEAGSAAAAEAIIRNNNGEEQQNIQEAIKQAIEAAKEEAQKQTQIEQEMLKALQGIRLPATVQVAV